MAATAGMAALPDLPHLLPILAWVLFGEGGAEAVQAYAFAKPGLEPSMPHEVVFVSHHLHCIMHSAIVAGAVTLLAWGIMRRVWFPLWGWWLHILIDIPTHSADYYPVPVLYPITQQGFDGIAWTTPWFMALNYGLLAATYLWLARRRWPALGPSGH
ncbi:MAG TPA: hypothetical protein VMN83_14560 [Albitalea sp.]|nr:hypothetical protein [Albitalea sp.]